ncbi:MAG: thioredoxin domain-containing protein [Patescibacteria group bacterium]|jgi:protein-disulfide isomerase
MYESESAGKKRKGRSVGAVIGWTVLSLIFVFLAYIGYRTWYYYDKIRHGELIDLSQFAGEMTTSDSVSPFAAVYADRSVVEDQNAPAFGVAGEAARLTVVEFGDYHCPFSQQVASVVREMMTIYGDRVRFIHRDFPTKTDLADPLAAAVAARCANEQGKFWQYYDRLYVNPERLEVADLTAYATQVNLDQTRFEQCLLERRHEAAVASDMREGRALGIRGTPTFFFNGIKVEGALNRQAFQMIIDKLLQ